MALFPSPRDRQNLKNQACLLCRVILPLRFHDSVSADEKTRLNALESTSGLFITHDDDKALISAVQDVMKSHKSEIDSVTGLSAQLHELTLFYITQWSGKAIAKANEKLPKHAKDAVTYWQQTSGNLRKAKAAIIVEVMTQLYCYTTHCRGTKFHGDTLTQANAIQRASSGNVFLSRNNIIDTLHRAVTQLIRTPPAQTLTPTGATTPLRRRHSESSLRTPMAETGSAAQEAPGRIGGNPTGP